MKQTSVWRIVSGVVMVPFHLPSNGLTIGNPDYTTALLFVSAVPQMLTYLAYNNSFPAGNE